MHKVGGESPSRAPSSSLTREFEWLIYQKMYDLSIQGTHTWLSSSLTLEFELLDL